MNLAGVSPSSYVASPDQNQWYECDYKIISMRYRQKENASLVWMVDQNREALKLVSVTLSSPTDWVALVK